MISELMFLGSSVAMIYFAYISIPKEDDATMLNVMYGIFATWLAWDNSKLLLTDHINTFSGGVAMSLSSDVYSHHYFVFALLTGAITIYVAVEVAKDLFDNGDDDE